jgi:hypothetical protein
MQAFLHSVSRASVFGPHIGGAFRHLLPILMQLQKYILPLQLTDIGQARPHRHQEKKCYDAHTSGIPESFAHHSLLIVVLSRSNERHVPPFQIGKGADRKQMRMIQLPFLWEPTTPNILTAGFSRSLPESDGISKEEARDTASRVAKTGFCFNDALGNRSV